ncbi:Fc.00g046120.m01.CDS01 [Cosmosporella sp. VM-42]
MDLVIWWPTNATTPTGIVASSANCRGGFVRGGFDADILPIGAAFEEIYNNEEGEHSNRYHMINAKNETFVLDVKGVLNYVNNTLHGFGWGTFRTTAKSLKHINYKPYVFEVAAGFNSGHAQASLFEVTSNGGGTAANQPRRPWPTFRWQTYAYTGNGQWINSMSPKADNAQSSASPDSHRNDSEYAIAAPASDSASERPITGGHGPMAAIPFDQPVAVTASGTPLLNPRSCVICRKRKVRCDKTMPCANCRRTQFACMFPAPARARRQPRPKDPNALPKPGTSEREADLVKRLRKLESVVNELSGQAEAKGDKGAGETNFSTEAETNFNPDDTNQYHSRTSPGDIESPRSQGAEVIREAADEAKRKTEGRDMLGIHKQLGRLVLHDGGKTSRYVNSGFWSKLNDELDELRNEMQAASDQFDESEDDNSPDNSPQQTFTADPDHHSFIMGYRSADVDLTKLHPLPVHVPFLWQIYLENVEPLLRVLHIPTMEKLIRNMRWRMDDLSPGDEALIFAIYYAAVTSMEEDEVQTNLGSSQSHFISQFRFALEQALAKANLLNTSDMAVLQAFTIFLTIVKRHDDSKFCWMLTGMCVRMAQGLGLHRDGVQLGLPPFEVEMRRRVWWAIMSIDLRSAEEMSSDLTVSDNSFDTQLPSNINDADIDPSSTEMPMPREGRTDVSVSLVRHEICALSRRLFTIMSEMGPVDPNCVEKSLEEREHMLIEVYDRIEAKFLKHVVTDDDPIFWMGALIARVIMAKIGLIIYQPLLFPGTGPDLSNEIRSRLWVSTIQIVEYNYILNTDPRCRQWRWLFQTYRQWHAIAYMLLEASRRPWTVTSERAWEAAQILGNDHSIESMKSKDHTAVWMPVKRLYIKAKRHREAEVMRLRADPAAAQRLDVEDRMSTAPERLGPIPGMESRESDLRLRWRKLVRTENLPSEVPFQMSILPDPSQSITIRPQAGEVDSMLPQNSVSPEQEGGLINNTVTVQGPLDGNPSPFLWPGSLQSSHGNAQSGAGSIDGMDELLQGGVIYFGDFSPDMDDLDMNTDMFNVDDINWQNWNEALKGLNGPSASDLPSGTGRWGGM